MRYWREEPYFPPEHPDELTPMERSPDLNERDTIEQQINLLEARLWNATHLGNHSGIILGQTTNPFPNYDNIKKLLGRLEEEVWVDQNPELKLLSELIRKTWYEVLRLSGEHEVEIKRLRAEINRLDDQLRKMDVDQSTPVLAQL
ncbi:hypothetical protein EBR57_02700 [bacterium]|nr:hypothetical protein [bacterium]